MTDETARIISMWLSDCSDAVISRELGVPVGRVRWAISRYIDENETVQTRPRQRPYPRPDAKVRLLIFSDGTGELREGI